MTHDDLDRRIVNALLADGRASLRSIADDLDVAATTVSSRLERLEEAGVVVDYVPRIDYAKLGYELTALFQFRVQSGTRREITERLAEQTQLISVYEVTGRYDVVAIGKYTDTGQMNAQIETLLAAPSILESNSIVGLSTPFEFRQFRLDAIDP